ncbi:MAG: hypothetical protein JST82_09065 [Bacteroidetes bacterium]|nr:hypothetical protein [Bacteroidota bacterium]
MKNTSLIIVMVAFVFASCSKSDIVFVDPEGVTNSKSPTSLKYADITGDYILFDSIHFIGNQAYQPIQVQKHYPIYNPVKVNINTSNASFVFNNKTYYESHGVQNEYIASDSYFDINKIWFTRDSIYINYLKRSYIGDSSLNITMRGYKL